MPRLPSFFSRKSKTIPPKAQEIQIAQPQITAQDLLKLVRGKDSKYKNMSLSEKLTILGQYEGDWQITSGGQDKGGRRIGLNLMQKAAKNPKEEESVDRQAF